MKTFNENIKELLAKVKAFEGSEGLKAQRKLPGNCYFVSTDEVLTYGNNYGEIRYPYAYDGLTLWAFATGYVYIEESTLNIMLPSREAKEPNLGFFVGEKQGDEFFPISLLGTAKQANEKGVKRRCIFTPSAVYYVTETSTFTGVVRILIDDKKLLQMSVYVENTSGKELDIYFSSYMNFCMSVVPFEAFELKWFKRCFATDYGYVFNKNENGLDNIAVVARSEYNGSIERTTSRSIFTGGVQNQLYCSTPLFTGKFDREKLHTEFCETGIAGEILPMQLGVGQTFELNYAVAFGLDEALVAEKAIQNRDIQLVEEYLDRKKNIPEEERLPKIEIGDIEQHGLNSFTVSSFMENVARQVEFCARSKNYAGSLIGIRDIFQQLEASLMWIPAYSRKKIVEALNYIGEDGRAPRQYSYPAKEGVLPDMDLRPYIDQGVWIISTIYTYLCFTGDYSILEEECGYYKFDKYNVDFSTQRDTVLDHLVRITEFLLSKISRTTDCLRILHGDWNDAVNGLGRSDTPDRQYGDGVSVMATLQLYRNLGEMNEIFRRVNRYTEKIATYDEVKERIRLGLQKHAIVENDKGERKLVHGWGDKLRYKIASFCDNDLQNRDGLTSNAFWILCDALSWDESLKSEILNAYARLDSKYGFKTFEPYFSKENKDIGGIVHLPKGTGENGATYIHATLFAIMSLFEIGEAQMAWEQILKILPLTHSYISTTPFIMSNSYMYNEEKCLDGESQNDWFTGSGCVLIKALVWNIFGISPSLDGLNIAPANYFPTKNAFIQMRVKGCEISVSYRNEGKGDRSFIVNGTHRKGVYKEKSKNYCLYFTNEELTAQKIEIVCID